MHQFAELSGAIKTKQAALKEREADLNDEYKDIEARYRAQLIRTKVRPMRLDRADRADRRLHEPGPREVLQGAREVRRRRSARLTGSAILAFHEHKMQEINDTLAGLWTKCYQGTDIDTIKISADAEGGARKNYSYRVVMLKDKVEMDMRGRCSAGQKVLACILIRLALAESFGTQCGFLALDEPTVRSFAMWRG